MSERNSCHFTCKIGVHIQTSKVYLNVHVQSGFEFVYLLLTSPIYTKLNPCVRFKPAFADASDGEYV